MRHASEKLAFMVVVGACILFSAVGISRAAVITYHTPAGSELDDLPVHAEAEFTTGNGQLTIELRNLQADPRSVIQNVSDLFFKVSTGQTDGTIASSLGVPREIDGDGGYDDGAPVDTGWKLESVVLDDMTFFHLVVLGTTIGPAHTLIGPPNAGTDNYDDAKGSIAGNMPHNPFLAEEATFVIDIEGLTANSTVTDAIFSFGTEAGENIVGVPEPAALTLAGLALVAGVLAFSRRRS
jgi:hypothetical protein